MASIDVAALDVADAPGRATSGDAGCGPSRTTTAWPVTRPVWLAVAAVVAVGMAYSFLWAPVFLHASFWVTPGDIWNTVAVSELIRWGGGKIIYLNDPIIVPPAFALILVPVAFVGTALHLTRNTVITLPHPTMWLLVGPVELFVGSLVLFPIDAWARRLGVAGRQRLALLCVASVFSATVMAVYGHPEDMLALGCALYGLIAVREGRFGRASWWMGAAVAFQPLALLLVPLALAFVPSRRWLRFCVTAAVPTLAVIADPLVGAWSITTRALVDQPTFPQTLWPTPWVHLAPVIGRTLKSALVVNAAKMSPDHVIVAAGPSRLLAVAVSICVAVYAARSKPSDLSLLWLAALCMAARCVFDAVLCPYYVIPAILLATVAAAASGNRRLLVVSLAGAGTALFAYFHGPLWAWYAEYCGLLLTTLGAAVPPTLLARRRGAFHGADRADDADVVGAGYAGDELLARF